MDIYFYNENDKDFILSFQKINVILLARFNMEQLLINDMKEIFILHSGDKY